FTYAPQEAAAAFKGTKQLSFTCLTMADPPYDLLALALKKQLQAIGVDMEIKEVAPDELVPAAGRAETDAVLVDAASGWSPIRAYRFWHPKGPGNMSHFASKSVDASLDRLSHANSEDEYRAALAGFQNAVSEDPPAIFIAWGERARVVSKRF